jgi:serine protease inhibitor
MALGMTYNGAAGTTEAAMRETLELQGFTLEEVNQSYRDLIALLRGLDPHVRLHLANSIWYRRDIAFEPTFLATNRVYYDASVQALDFAEPAAPDMINDWVREATEGLITKIVPSPIPEYVVMYLLNAIHFKGDWRQQFDTARTHDAPFRLADGSTTTVPMMSHGGPADVRTFSDAGVQVVDLPYGGGAFSMTIALPPEPAGIDALVAGLTAERWNAWISQLSPESAFVFLPKFKLVNDLSLEDVLTALGMGIAFDCGLPDMADFGRMRPERDVCITRVKHKSYVDVNEEGTEAAAVTSVEIGIVCLCGPPTIVVDRPFVFAIRENLSGTVLFLGRVLNPRAS